MAKKERAEAEADEKDKQKEIPLDEIEAEGEFVPPKVRCRHSRDNRAIASANC